jgi:hypothetical protein
LSQEADIYAKRRVNDTALQAASFSRCRSIVELLVNAYDRQLVIVLEKESFGGHSKIELLVGEVAKIDVEAEHFNILLGAVPEQGHEEIIEKTGRNFFFWVIFSERPPRIEIAISPEGEIHLLPELRVPHLLEISRYCSSIVVVSTKDNPHQNGDQNLELQRAHFAVKEYPTSDRLGKDIGECFQEVAAEVSIATACLAYLLHLDLDLLIQTIFPLVQYSARHPASPFRYASSGGCRKTARYGDTPQTVPYRGHENVQVVELLLGKVSHAQASTNGQLEPWAGFILYELLALVVGVLIILEFIVNAIGKGKKSSDSWTEGLTYTTCLIEAIYGDLHTSHPNSPGAVPVATYRSGPAHEYSSQHSADRKSFLQQIRQRVRSLT